ncbi:STN domain-containing protein [Tunicatimonas pelagia]|uniref:STN domain-containing protein n=1 Tax=Tunicatimonas pelagia TaxID=931531 RepID=UPI0026663189|nr:STN domain-containing protein [Tunicatimonas pelagia]WKN41493.1 STN domain-containing protein [Tunicatimonas pelagia]
MTTSLYSFVGGLLLLCISSFYPPQTDILRQKVSATYQNATLQEVLIDLQQRYGLKFAYLNNELPNGLSVTLNFENVPLGKVLDTVLSDTSLSYQLVDDQIVLKNIPEKQETRTPAPEIEKNTTPNQSSSTSTAPTSASDAELTTSTETDVSPLIEEESSTEDSVPNSQSPDEVFSGNNVSNDLTQGEEILQEETTKKPTEETTVANQPNPVTEADTVSETITEKVPLVEKKVESNQPEKNQASESDKTPVSDKITREIRQGMNHAIFNNLPEESSYETRPFHVGLIYPLSTNGINAGQYVNRISLHALIGYSAGLNGVEASGFGNIENDFVSGVQAAGFFNLVKNRVNGVQAAGFANLNGGVLEGGQFTGFLNTNLDSLEGVQGAGFLNLSTGYTDGVQGAGFANIITQDAHAVQAAGFANIATSRMKGGQFAGFGNYAHSVDGAQIAGFTNVATGDVNGFQASGFLNVARHVKGVQLSFLNVADSIDGVPIGFLSIVRKNGYRALEVWGGEALHANVAFKIGVRKFYNIFSFGSQFADTDFRYGLGYGVGHVTALSPTVDLSLDLLSQQIYEEDNWIFSNNQKLNLLNTFRIGFSKQLSQNFALFAAPTFNVLVSEIRNGDGTIGSNLAPYRLFNQTYDGRTNTPSIPDIPGEPTRFQQGRTNVQMWVGFNVGLRF